MSKRELRSTAQRAAAMAGIPLYSEARNYRKKSENDRKIDEEGEKIISDLPTKKVLHEPILIIQQFDIVEERYEELVIVQIKKARLENPSLDLMLAKENKIEIIEKKVMFSLEKEHRDASPKLFLSNSIENEQDPAFTMTWIPEIEQETHEFSINLKENFSFNIDASVTSNIPTKHKKLDAYQGPGPLVQTIMQDFSSMIASTPAHDGKNDPSLAPFFMKSKNKSHHLASLANLTSSDSQNTSRSRSRRAKDSLNGQKSLSPEKKLVVPACVISICEKKNSSSVLPLTSASEKNNDIVSSSSTEIETTAEAGGDEILNLGNRPTHSSAMKYIDEKYDQYVRRDSIELVKIEDQVSSTSLAVDDIFENDPMILAPAIFYSNYELNLMFSNRNNRNNDFDDMRRSRSWNRNWRGRGSYGRACGRARGESYYHRSTRLDDNYENRARSFRENVNEEWPYDTGDARVEQDYNDQIGSNACRTFKDHPPPHSVIPDSFDDAVEKLEKRDFVGSRSSETNFSSDSKPVDRPTHDELNENLGKPQAQSASEPPEQSLLEHSVNNDRELVDQEYDNREHFDNFNRENVRPQDENLQIVEINAQPRNTTIFLRDEPAEIDNNRQKLPISTEVFVRKPSPVIQGENFRMENRFPRGLQPYRDFRERRLEPFIKNSNKTRVGWDPSIPAYDYSPPESRKEFHHSHRPMLQNQPFMNTNVHRTQGSYRNVERIHTRRPPPDPPDPPDPRKPPDNPEFDPKEFKMFKMFKNFMKFNKGNDSGRPPDDPGSSSSPSDASSTPSEHPIANRPRARRTKIVVRGTNPCPVPRFKVGNNITIESWFYQMETHFELNGITEDKWVKSCISNIHAQYFDEIYQHKQLPYCYFKP